MEKRVATEMKPRIFEIAFRVKEIGVEGYVKPKNAQTAKTMNIAPRENIEYLLIKARLDNNISDRVNNTATSRVPK